MKSVSLTNSSQVALVDDVDFEAVSQFSCSWNEARRYVQACLPRAGRPQVKHHLHIFLMGHREGLEIDHRDGNPLNNQRENLRWATHAQNMANRKKGVGLTSSFKGVSWVKSRSKWLSSIRVNNKTVNLGRYSTEAEAALAYNKAAEVRFGAFAKLNPL